MGRADEHAYIRIGKDIKTGRIPGLVVLLGKEQFLVNFYAAFLTKKYVNEASKSLDLVSLDRESVTADEIIEAVETISILSERKVVVVNDFIDSKGKYPKNLQPKSRDFDRLIAYIEKIPEGAMLILTIADQEEDMTAKEIAKSKLLQTAASCGSVYDFGPLDHGQLRGFIDKRFRGSGKSYRPSLVDLIARESGYGNKNVDYGLYELDNDLKKIIAHSGRNAEITSDDIISVITINPENNIFGMLDAIGENRKDRALSLLHNLTGDGVNEFRILSMITSQLELMLITKEMNDEGMNLPAIQQVLYKQDRTNKYRVENALRCARRFRTEDLRRILSSAYDVDMNIKSGLYPAELALELLITGV
ncbi:MAG: DNA polymerase III subunit delta [Bacillota bacterium]|nr:DNA polymerase III subunit delta [Bacillota bacterium]